MKFEVLTAVVLMIHVGCHSVSAGKLRILTSSSVWSSLIITILELLGSQDKLYYDRSQSRGLPNNSTSHPRRIVSYKSPLFACILTQITFTIFVVLDKVKPYKFFERFSKFLGKICEKICHVCQHGTCRFPGNGLWLNSTRYIIITISRPSWTLLTIKTKQQIL